MPAHFWYSVTRVNFETCYMIFCTVYDASIWTRVRKIVQYTLFQFGFVSNSMSVNYASENLDTDQMKSPKVLHVSIWTPFR